MAKRNFLVEGGSGTGKSAVCHALRKRGYKAIDGDNELAYQGEPGTGRGTGASRHASHVWDVDEVRAIAAKTDDEVVFVCGGSRNFKEFLDVFEQVFVLDVDTETLKRRLESRAADDWGGKEEEKALILRLHATKEDVPEGIIVDSARPLDEVVDVIVERIQASS